MAAYIYKLVDPRNPSKIRYIGYTAKTVPIRLSEHLKEARSGSSTHKCNWIRSLLQAGLKPIAEVLELVDGDWQEREKFWIALYKDSLTNSTAGGEGLINPSQEVRDRISSTLIAGGSGLGNQYRTGILHTEESKQSISKGLLSSEKNRIAVAASRGVDKHRSMTEEQKMNRNEKIRQSKLGKKRAPFSDETRKNMSIAHIGTKLPSASLKKQGSRFINNGTLLKQTKAGEPLPDGWFYGMKLKGNSNG